MSATVDWLKVMQILKLSPHTEPGDVAELRFHELGDRFMAEQRDKAELIRKEHEAGHVPLPTVP